jgi:hypothetical protein
MMQCLLLDLKAMPGGPLLTLPGGKVNGFVCLQSSLIQKLCPQAKGQAADFPVCHAEDFQIVSAVDGRHQDFEELRLEIQRMVLRVFFPELCPIAVQVLQGVNAVIVQVDELHGVYLLRDLEACGSG